MVSKFTITIHEDISKHFLIIHHLNLEEEKRTDICFRRGDIFPKLRTRPFFTSKFGATYELHKNGGRMKFVSYNSYSFTKRHQAPNEQSLLESLILAKN